MVSSSHAAPRTERVVGDLLREQARANPGKRFLTFGESELSFSSLDEKTDRIAAGLWECGVRPGDRVAILSVNRLEVVELFFAVAKLGAVQVSLNAFLKGEFLRYQLSDCRATTLVVDGSGFTAALPLVDSLMELRLLITLDDGPSTNPSDIDVRKYADLPARSEPAPDVAVSPSDLMSIVYTSGTTGQPKGCMLSHGYYTRVGRVVGEALELTPDDVLFTALPLFHSAARMMVLTCGLVYGLPVVIEAEFSAKRFVTRAVDVGATVFYGVGAMGAALLGTEPSAADHQHRLRAMLLIPFPAERQPALAKRFGVEVYAELFGQTECLPVTWSPLSGSRERASCGLPSPDLEVVLLDDDDRPVTVGAVGEICVRPREPLVMFSGYWGKPEATVDASRSLWHHTGDFGRADEAGFVYFVDRKKDAVRRRGENVSTQEIEAAIVLHPAIAEVAAHGVQSPSTDDDIKICLVLAEGSQVNPGELFDFFKDRLPYFAIPRYVEILTELPKNAVARVLKFELRKRPMSDAVWDFEELGMRVTRDERR